ncbi:uncharacterized protein LOC125378050 [Haliotis rufescens]|uniref:uncharacterized protein LOC125378050 n=1 Tax=Haliotis rufescens TaxID=6454 RepID=UPI00201FB2FE|nr:uncharacterized protein LOC125378050 [Haliotis rufescens]
MASQHPGSKRRYIESDNSPDENTTNRSDYWPRFLIIEACDKEPIKLNPFAISKGIAGACGKVTNVTKLRSGSLLVECAQRQQSINLLGLKEFVNIKVAVSEHRTLNSYKGIVRDRARCLSGMTEDEIVKELVQQSVTAVKRFTVKKDGLVVDTNTYLFTFARSKIPQSIKAGYCNIGVEVYIPNPLRCYTCQAFGHGSKSCRASAVCYRCGDKHEATDCRKDVKCSNCGGSHMASSKSCPVWQHELQIMKIKTEQNLSYYEAKKRVAAVTPTSVTPKKKTVKNVESQTPKATSESEPEPVKLSNREKKLLKKKQLREQLQTPKATSPLEVPVEVHNSFGPLDMEVTPSPHDTNRSTTKSSSRSRDISPVEAPP